MMMNIIHFNIQLKTGLRKFLGIIILGFVLLFSIVNYPAVIHGAEFGDKERIKSLTAKIRLNPADKEARWGLAQAYFELAGFKDYFQAKSWLWTENTFKKTTLSSQLPPVIPQAAQYCRQQLLAIFNRDPGVGPALTMAGDYHYFYNHKEIALWYYRRAVELNPGSTVALLALADFYLSEWQPAKVLDLLSKHSGPDFALRKGIAWIQSSEYQLALGYLLQADSLPSRLQVTKDLNLFKVYIALGDYGHGNNFRAENFPGIIPATLFKELQGWGVFLAGDFKAAERLWNEGVKMNPDYYFWQSNPLGRGNSTPLKGVQNVPQFKRNNFFQAVAWTLQGRLYMGNGNSGSSYQAFLAGIKADPLSLMGFLAAGRMSFQKQEYPNALDLLNQGLAVNSKFGPLLSERAKVYEALGLFQEANQDREAAGLNTTTKLDATAPLSLVPAWKGKNKSAVESVYIIIRGNTQDLAGFWVSGDGSDWDWISYWGGPMVVPSRLKQGWWLPVGPGLSGRAYYLDNLSPEKFPGVVEPPRVTEDGRALVFKFPVPVKLVVPIRRGASTGTSFVSEQFETEHIAPIELFGRDNRALDYWFQTKNGAWNRSFFNVPPTGEQNQATPEIHNTVETDLNHSTETASPPKLSSVLIADSLPEGYQIVWSADQAVSSWLRLLSDRGVWSEIPAIIDPYGCFRGWVPKTALFGRIALKSEVDGTVVYYGTPELNRRLSQNRSCRFVVNNGSRFVNSRNIVIQLEADYGSSLTNSNVQTIPQFQWSISNDQRVWSPWHQGINTCPWRLNSAEGEQLVYIRYKLTGNPASAEIAVVPVTLDTLPPEVETVNWEFQTTGRQTKVMAISFRFSEPVLLKTIIPEAGKTTAGENNDSTVFQSEFTIELPIQESPVMLELTVRDQAGHESGFYWQADTAGLHRKSDGK